jgi:hypothetical protein
MTRISDGPKELRHSLVNVFDVVIRSTTEAGTKLTERL